MTIAFGDKAATDAAFAKAKHVAAVRLVNNRVTANPIEPRCAIGVYDAADGRYTLYTTSQDPHSVRAALSSDVFHVPESKIRVISPDVGGGFGMKANIYPDDVLVLWASKRCGRPVKWTATRSESLLCDNHARDQIVYGELALDEQRQVPRHPVDRLSGAGRLLVGGRDGAAVLVGDVHSQSL